MRNVTNSSISGKPTGIRKYIRQNHMTRAEASAVCATILESSQEQLNDFLADQDTPILIVGLVTAVMIDLKRGTTQALDLLLNRAYGKPDQTMTVQEDLPSRIVKMTPQEREEKIKEILARQGYVKANDSEVIKLGTERINEAARDAVEIATIKGIVID